MCSVGVNISGVGYESEARANEKNARANIEIGDGRQLALPRDPLDAAGEVEETVADVRVDADSDIENRLDVETVDDGLDGMTDGDVRELEGVTTGFADVVDKWPTVMVDVLVPEAVERVREGGIRIADVAPGSGLSNEPDMPVRLIIEWSCQLNNLDKSVKGCAPKVGGKSGVRSAVSPFKFRRSNGDIADKYLERP